MVVCVNWPPTCIVALIVPLANGLQNGVITHELIILGEMRSYVINHYCFNVMCCVAPESTIQSYMV
jgi:hypothetical protein